MTVCYNPARYGNRTSPTGIERPSISAFFPAYNDGGTIGSLVVTTLNTLAELTDDYEVIVVENGSTDYTVEVLEELAQQYEQLRVLTHREALGYGGALRVGFASASKELIFYTDGDAQYDPRELKLLLPAHAAAVSMSSTATRSAAPIRCTA